MFEEYLQDAYEFLNLASQQVNDRSARRYYRASVFYAAGAIEAFLNYLADSFARAGSIPQHEICFLNDRVLRFSVVKGLVEKIEFHRIEDKIRLLTSRFAASFDFQSRTWSDFVAFKDFRNSLVHPREVEDETTLTQYKRSVSMGLRATIEIMNQINLGVFSKPLRKQLLDLIPE